MSQPKVEFDLDDSPYCNGEGSFCLANLADGLYFINGEKVRIKDGEVIGDNMTTKEKDR